MQKDERRYALIVAGPTASGKSALAIDVAEHFHGTVINADSMQVYRELRKITARPSIADESRVPHRLFGVMNGYEACSAGAWTRMAVDEIHAAFAQNRLPVVVGGTGLYLQSLSAGLSPIPSIPEAVRTRARARLGELGTAAFAAEVAELDPVSAERLAPADTQRLLRAWEVFMHTGRTFSAWRDVPRVKPLPEVRFATIVLAPPRQQLYGAIDARFVAMMDDGALDEVRALLAMGLDRGLPVMKALGVPELSAHLQGRLERDEAIARAQRASRNYAKRQLTWGRHQIDGAFVLRAQYSKSFYDEIIAYIHQFLLTGGD